MDGDDDEHVTELPPRAFSARGQLTLHYANERTLLAWIRTATALMGFGYAVARFALFLEERADPSAPHRDVVTHAGGIVMTLAGLAALVIAVVRFRSNRRVIERGGPPEHRATYVYAFAAVIGVTGLGLVVLLLI